MDQPVITAFQDSATVDKKIPQDKAHLESHLIQSTHNLLFNNVSFDQTSSNPKLQQQQA